MPDIINIERYARKTSCPSDKKFETFFGLKIKFLGCLFKSINWLYILRNYFILYI